MCNSFTIYMNIWTKPSERLFVGNTQVPFPYLQIITLSQVFWYSSLMLLALLVHTFYLTFRLGRKTCICIALTLQTSSGVAAAFAPEFYSFCVLRLLNGASNAGLMINSFVFGEILRLFFSDKNDKSCLMGSQWYLRCNVVLNRFSGI